MKRAVVMGMLVLTLVVGATVAEAAVKKGTFSGRSTAGDPFGFKVNTSNRVVSFYFEGVHLECTDGDEIDTPTGRRRFQTPNVRGARFKIGKDRRFRIDSRDESTGIEWQVRARFNRAGSRAGGTFTFVAPFNEEGQLDPNGSIRCESGELRFSTRRR